jgi:hypothetical protein
MAGAPQKQYVYIILCHGKFGRDNSIYDMKWGAHTLGIFSSFVFTFRLLVLIFLWLEQMLVEQGFLVVVKECE